MPMTSPESAKIRRIVERLSEDDLLTKGPKDLEAAIVKVGLSYDAVRENVANELARARRKLGLRKGRGRRVAAPTSSEQDVERQMELFDEFYAFRENHFESWAELQEVAESLGAFRDRFGSDEIMMRLIERKAQEERGGSGRKAAPRTKIAHVEAPPPEPDE